LTAETSSQKRLGTALFYGIVALLAFMAFQVFDPFLAPLAWAIVLVVVSHPAYEWLARRMGPTTAAAISTAGVTLILIVPTILVMGSFIRQGVFAVKELHEAISSGRFAWVNELWLRIQARVPSATPGDLATTLERYAEQAAGYMASRLGTVLQHTALFLFHLTVAILAMFYLFRDGDSIVRRLREVLPFEDAHRERMIREAQDLIFASVTSTLVAAAVHGIAGGLAFAVTGIHAPIFWGVMMGFFSLVPVVGSSLIWAPAGLSLIFSGHLGHGILLMVICGLLVALVDNVVRPWIISGRAEMGGLIVFISVLGGISAFGMLGIVLGPIVVATAASLLELYVPSAPAGNKTSKASGRKRSGVLE
jgi:predicted PurR-regulated permease PerM